MKGKVWKRSMQVLGFIIICGLALFSVKGKQSQEMKAQSTLKDNKLGLCSEKPNCVSSFQDKNDEHYIAPSPFISFPMEQADQFFKDCKIEIKSENYRHYTCTSNIFKFVDDVEIFVLENIIYYRSASRVGHSDLGKNRKRIEDFQKTFIKYK